MAEENGKNLFRKSALSQIASVDDLDQFLKVTNPSAWITICAFLALFAGLLVWSLTAEVPVTTTTSALVVGDRSATCWVDASLAEKLRESDACVRIDGKEASSITVGVRPMSSGEVMASMGDGPLADGLSLVDWNYQVDLTFSENLYGAGEQGPFLAPADVVTAVEHPISLVFGG